MKWKILHTKQAQKDAKKISSVGLKVNTQKIICILEKNPLQNPLSYEKLLGDLERAYSRRINIQHKLVYQILDDKKIVKILRMWTHYE